MTFIMKCGIFLSKMSSRLILQSCKHESTYHFIPKGEDNIFFLHIFCTCFDSLVLHLYEKAVFFLAWAFDSESISNSAQDVLVRWKFSEKFVDFGKENNFHQMLTCTWKNLPARCARRNGEVPVLEHLLEVYEGVDKCLHLKTYLLEVYGWVEKCLCLKTYLLEV